MTTWWALSLTNLTWLFISLHFHQNLSAAISPSEKPSFSMYHVTGECHSPLPILNPHSPSTHHPSLLILYWLCSGKGKPNWRASRKEWFDRQEVQQPLHMTNSWWDTWPEEKEIWSDVIIPLKIARVAAKGNVLNNVTSEEGEPQETRAGNEKEVAFS